MLDFLMNIFSGGALGVVTSMFSTWFKFKEKQQADKHELDLIAAQSAASINEINANVEAQKVVTEGEVKLEENRADTAEAVGRSTLISTLTGKYLSDDILKIMLNDNTFVGKLFRPLIYLHVLFMDAVRGLIRPMLTVGIIYYVTYIVNISMKQYLASDTGMDSLMNMVIQPSIMLILFSASTVIGFWFADKSMARRFQKGNSNAK